MRITTLFVVALMLLASNLLAADFVELKDVSGKHIIKVEIKKVANAKVQVTDEKGKTAEYPLAIFDRDSLILILNVVGKMKDIQKPNNPPSPLNDPVKDFRLLRTLKGHTSFVLSVAFSPDGKRIASVSGDKTLKIWDAETGKVLGTLKPQVIGSTAYYQSVAFSPDGKQIVSGLVEDISLYRMITIFDANTGKFLNSLIEKTKDFTGLGYAVYSVAYSPDGKRIISGSDDHTIKIWDANTRNVLQTLKGHTAHVLSVAFSPDGHRIVSGIPASSHLMHSW